MARERKQPVKGRPTAGVPGARQAAGDQTPGGLPLRSDRDRLGEARREDPRRPRGHPPLEDRPAPSLLPPRVRPGGAGRAGNRRRCRASRTRPSTSRTPTARSSASSPGRGRGAWWWWFWPIFCNREEIATTMTDECGKFCVWIPRWDIDRILLVPQGAHLLPGDLPADDPRLPRRDPASPSRSRRSRTRRTRRIRRRSTCSTREVLAQVGERLGGRSLDRLTQFARATLVRPADR